MCSDDRSAGANGWKALVAQFFPGVCEQVVGEYLDREGFSRLPSSDPSAVLFVRGSKFLQFSYQVEDSPGYSPVVSLGFILVLDRASSDYELHGIGLWRLIPDDDDCRSYGDWTFRTEKEAQKSLMRIRNEALPAFAIPAINDSERLSGLIDAARSEVEAQHDDEVQKKNLRNARKAFENRNFVLTAELYRRVQKDRLTDADRKRFELARSRGGGEH